MKKTLILLACFIIFSFALKAQTAKWFITVSSGLSLGGPGPSIKNNMDKNGFNATANNFFFGGTTQFPYVSHGLPLLLMLGKRISTYRSVYLIVGESNRGEARGYNGDEVVSVKYDVLQFTAGYQFSFPTTRFKIGAGPSVFAFKYANTSMGPAGEKHTAILPGLSVTGRLPFGKEKKLFGVELFFETNFAPRGKVGEIQTYRSSLKASNVNIIHGIIGLSFALRK
jgi:hypothetical protein